MKALIFGILGMVVVAYAASVVLDALQVQTADRYAVSTSVRISH